MTAVAQVVRAALADRMMVIVVDRVQAEAPEDIQVLVEPVVEHQLHLLELRQVAPVQAVAVEVEVEVTVVMKLLLVVVV
jgi:hypothetical protein